MKTTDKKEYARKIAIYFQSLGYENVKGISFADFDRAWFELHSYHGMEWPDISGRVAKTIWRLFKDYPYGI